MCSVGYDIVFSGSFLLAVVTSFVSKKENWRSFSRALAWNFSWNSSHLSNTSPSSMLDNVVENFATWKLCPDWLVLAGSTWQQVMTTMCPGNRHSETQLLDATKNHCQCIFFDLHIPFLSRSECSRGMPNNSLAWITAAPRPFVKASTPSKVCFSIWALQ